VLLGCERPPIEGHIEGLMRDVVTPAIVKALAENPLAGGSLAGGVQGIEPGYRARFSGKWVVGIEGDVEIYARGVAGTLTGSATLGAPKP
jgi:hypothetical protein